MKTRTETYLGTFLTNEDGYESYKRLIKNLRQYVKGGRFVKMYRGNKRNHIYQIKSGCSPKKGATHFDVYLHPRYNVLPKFFNFELTY